MRFKILFLLLFCSANVFAQKKFTVSGYITDAKSSETVIGATVYDQQTKQGTVTNVFGFYSLTLTEGNHTLNFSYVGYQPQNKEITLTENITINIKLQDNAELEEVVVTAKKEDAGVEATGMGSIDIPVDIIKHTPSLLGETDVMRTIQLTPGVQQGVGGASSIYVRGGSGDENLVLLDGANVYKIDHLFGFFSVFTPEAVKRVTFYKSSFPARYNGRTSSVIDVRTKDGDMHNYHGSFSIGLLTSRINFEGPIVKDKTSLNVSARTTYFSAVSKPFMSDDVKFSYWFYDLNLKLNHKFSDKDRLFFALYSGLDKYKDDYIDDDFNVSIRISDGYDPEIGYEKFHYEYTPVHETYGTNLKWGNVIPSLRWNHVFSSKLFANTTVNYNHYKMKMSSYDEIEYHFPNVVDYYEYQKSSYHSEIEDFGAIIDFDWLPSPQHTVKFGANYTYHTFSPETMSTDYKNKATDIKTIDTTASSTGKPIYANELSLYVEDDYKILDNLNINVGLSYTMFALKNKTYYHIQPRVSLKFMPMEYLSFKVSYSRMSQCVHLLTSMPIAMPTDLWVPVTEEFKPETADQFSVGAYFTKVKNWEFSLEGYYKKLDNVLEYKDGMSFMGFSGAWQQLVAAGEGTSKGVEIMAEKTTGKITGWVAYTLSKTDRKFDRNSGVNDGEKFPFAYDRRHNVNVVFNYNINKRIDFDATWTFYSGACATISTAYQQYLDPENSEYYYENKAKYVPSRNNYRLPCSHLLCLGVNFHKQKTHCERIWNFSIYNAYNAKNPAFVYLEEYNEYGDLYTEPKLKKITILPIIPSVTLTYKF